MKKCSESMITAAASDRSRTRVGTLSAAAFVGIGILMSACATSSDSPGSGLPGASFLGIGGGSEAGAAKEADSGASPAIDGLKLSNVTARGLRAAGVQDLEGLIAWFNAIPGDGDPFLGPMVAEIENASSSAESMEALKLSGVTVEALAAQKITAPSELPTFDREVLKDSRKPMDLCRNEIARVMQEQGWTVLRAEITNQPRAGRIYLNETLVGPIAAGDKPVWRRFLINGPGPASDPKVFATLTVDIPNAADGMPAARWYRDIEVERGSELRIPMNIAEAPLPSIGFSAANPLSPAAVYAGDTVTLTCEGGDKDTVWFTFGSPSRLDASSYRTAPNGNTASVGLPAWFRLRSMAEMAASPRPGLLDEPRLQPILLGRGKTLRWTPQFETPSARIGVLTRGAGGFWGFAERSIAVADLRPGVWMMPELPIDPDSRGVLEAAAFDGGSAPGNIYLTHEVLGELVYLAKVGQAFSVDLRLDEYRDASVPLASVSLDFGDGSGKIEIPAAEASEARVEHSFASSGDYRVTVVTRDILGFARTHSTTIRATAEAPQAESGEAPAVAAMPVVRRRPQVVTAESSFDLFRRAAEQFARQVAGQTGKAWRGRAMAIAHIHDSRNQNLLDLVDSTLVQALLAEGASVFEREPLYQHMIGARGFADASTVVVPDQGLGLEGAILAAANGASNPDTAAALGRLLSASTVPTPEVEVVLEYKLKRAEVNVTPAGSIVVRTARIFAWVRVHERKTMRILHDGDVAVTIGGTIAAAESNVAGAPWDSYPDGFMVRSTAPDRAVEPAKETTASDVAQPGANPATSGLPDPTEEGVGGMLKGLFGS